MGTHRSVRYGERGESLIEVVIAVAVVAIVAGVLSGATIAAVHRFGPDPIQSALEASVTREMRIAVDVMKYQGGTLPSGSLATTIPLPSGSPIPVSYSISTATTNGSVNIVLTATDRSDTTKTASLSQTIVAPAPLPGSRVSAPIQGNAPQ